MTLSRIVSVSGGKDSTAVALLSIGADQSNARTRFVFADTGNEHPITTEYVTDTLPRHLGITIETVKADFSAMLARKKHVINTKWRAEGIADDVCDRAIALCEPTGNPFLDLCLWKGRFPSRMAQFCTQELKRRPLDAVLLDALLSHGPVERWSGERRDESNWRAGYPERAPAAEGWTIVRPIVAWSAIDVIDFVRRTGCPLNPLYHQGFKRVGCAPCINSSKDDLLSWSRRHPEMIDKIREWEALVRDASKRRHAIFLASKGFGIDEANKWAKTSHGGRQYAIERMDMPLSDGCAAAHGLCE